MNSKCTACGKPVDQLHTVLKGQTLIEDVCETCVTAAPTSDFAREFERRSQRRKYAKDIIQKYDPEFARAYGVEAARDAGWSDEQIRKHI